MSDVLLIDNYDRNLYQYLSLQGAKVTVLRSQDLTLEELVEKHPAPSHVVISPGPGHPLRDSGISIPVIKAFAGKVPILGVCMGLQCIYAAYGGDVDSAGEVIHGKTSEVIHDSKGIFRNLKQGLHSTRYHSLAGNIKSLPDTLEVTSRTKSGVEGEKGDIVMGIRHKVFAIEAVQYHPESILSEEGQALLANFLQLKGGLWSDNPSFGLEQPSRTQVNGDTKPAPATILTKIAAQRTVDIDIAKRQPGTTPLDYASLLDLHAAPPIISLYHRLRYSSDVALMAEVKRASPSKGNILPPGSPLSSAGIALEYALAGASVISVLTEPKWFKGCLQDMRAVRAVVDSLPNRPAILRKDFILDTYQIDEARIFGADTILLIVAMLDDHTLQLLYDHSIKRGMEPLVEVNNAPELERALAIGARVIGVNNRNLHDFQVDMSTTSRVADLIRAKRGDAAKDVILCALSGISGRQDVTRYVDEGVSAVLVGEALMRADDKKAFVRDLLGLSTLSSEVKVVSPPDSISDPMPSTSTVVKHKTLVKICGIKTVEAALTAAECGADFIGMIFVPASKRCVSLVAARAIVKAVRSRSREAVEHDAKQELQTDWFSFQAHRLASSSNKPLLVGVFQDQPLADVIRIADDLQLDVVQLHGQEPLEWCRLLNRPVIKAFHVAAEETDLSGPMFQAASQPGYHVLPLFDTQAASSQVSGGSGQVFNWSIARSFSEARQAHKLPSMPIMLAGGLSTDNVLQAIEAGRPWAIDVSGSLETDGQKDVTKIGSFFKAIR